MKPFACTIFAIASLFSAQAFAMSIKSEPFEIRVEHHKPGPSFVLVPKAALVCAARERCPLDFNCSWLSREKELPLSVVVVAEEATRAEYLIRHDARVKFRNPFGPIRHKDRLCYFDITFEARDLSTPGTQGQGYTSGWASFESAEFSRIHLLDTLRLESYYSWTDWCYPSGSPLCRKSLHLSPEEDLSGQLLVRKSAGNTKEFLPKPE